MLFSPSVGGSLCLLVNDCSVIFNSLNLSVFRFPSQFLHQSFQISLDMYVQPPQCSQVFLCSASSSICGLYASHLQGLSAGIPGSVDTYFQLLCKNKFMNVVCLNIFDPNKFFFSSTYHNLLSWPTVLSHNMFSMSHLL